MCVGAKDESPVTTAAYFDDGSTRSTETTSVHFMESSTVLIVTSLVLGLAIVALGFVFFWQRCRKAAPNISTKRSAKEKSAVGMVYIFHSKWYCRESFVEQDNNHTSK